MAGKVILTRVGWSGAQIMNLEITFGKLEANSSPLVGVFHLGRRRKHTVLQGIFHRPCMHENMKFIESVRSHLKTKQKISSVKSQCFQMGREIKKVESGEKNGIPIMLFEMDSVMEMLGVPRSSLSNQSEKQIFFDICFKTIHIHLKSIAETQ